MKNLFCKKLAACLCMKRSSSPSPEPRLVMFKNIRGVDVGNGNNELTASSSETTELESMRRQLKEIRDLLDTRLCDWLAGRVHNEEQRLGDDKEEKMKHDWILAAAVLDRICSMTIIVVYIVGTIVLFVLFISRFIESLSASSAVLESIAVDHSDTESEGIVRDPPPPQVTLPLLPSFPTPNLQC